MMAKIEWYEEILALEPGSKVFFPFAKRLAEDGLHDKALSVLRHGLVQHPEYLEARVFLTHLLFAIGDTESAMTESQQVFARLAPYPAFWEALSLANEAIPGDMTLAMRFMAEALRAPGLTFAATLRRGLAPQGTQATAPALERVLAANEAADSAAIAEAVEHAELVEIADAEEVSEVSEVGGFAEIAEATGTIGASGETGATEAAEQPSASATPPELLADPLDPVESEVEAPTEANYPGSVSAESLLPLDDGDQPELPVQDETVDEGEPSADQLVVENVDIVLAAAASVDEVIAELVDTETPNLAEHAETEDANVDTDADTEEAHAPEVEGEEPPLLSLQDLEELDKTLFAEEPLVEGEEPPLLSLHDLEELDKTLFAEEPLADATDEQAELATVTELDELTDVANEAGEEGESPSASELPIDTPQAEAPPESAEPPVTFLDDGLLDFDTLDGVAETQDRTAFPEVSTLPEMAEFADVSLLPEIAEDAEEPDAQERERALEEPEAPELAAETAVQDVESAVHVHIQPANVPSAGAPAVPTDVVPDGVIFEDGGASDAFGAVAEKADDSDDTDLPDDGPVRTRSMADVLAEQGDIDGALIIYGELLHKAAPDEATSLGERMEALRGQKAVEKVEPRPAARADKAGLRSMLENLAGRLEKRAKA